MASRTRAVMMRCFSMKTLSDRHSGVCLCGRLGQDLFRSLAEAAFTPMKSRKGFVQGRVVEIRPELVAEVQLGIRGLPEQEIAQAHLTAGADQQVRIGH